MVQQFKWDCSSDLMFRVLVDDDANNILRKAGSLLDRRGGCTVSWPLPLICPHGASSRLVPPPPSEQVVRLPLRTQLALQPFLRELPREYRGEH